MIRLFIAAAALVVSPLSSLAQQLELKGLSPGMAKEALNTKMPDLKCVPDAASKSYSECKYLRQSIHQANVTELNTLAEELVESWSFEFIDDRLGRIVIILPISSFDAVVSALRIKFGAPTKSGKSIVQNRMGAKFESRQFTWSKNQQMLVATEFAGSLDDSAVVLLNQHYLNNLKRPANEEGRRRSKDI